MLCAARDDGDARYLILRDDAGMQHRLETTYFIDASVEADLARALGCSHTIGRHPLRYNDVRGPRPDPPSRTNLYTTSPQSLALLVTLGVSGDGAAESVSDHALWGHAAAALPTSLPPDVAVAFPQSWSMRHPLPHNKRELNEAWSDCPDCDLAFSWYLQAERRPPIVTLLQQRALWQVAQIQAALPCVGVASLPTWPYVRGEIMVVGEEVFDLEGLRQGRDDPIACGKYAVFDRHDTTSGAQQSQSTATVVLPYAAVKPQGHPYLLVSTAYSVDWRAYNSALRMEPVRANAGAACGALTALAQSAGSPYTQVDYAALLDEREAQGHVLAR